MAVAKSNGTGSKARVEGRCLGCLQPIRLDEMEGAVNRLTGGDMPELRSRIERVARDSDSNKALLESFDAKLDAIAEKQELSAAVTNKVASDIAMLLAGLGASIGRIGGRSPRKDKAP